MREHGHDALPDAPRVCLHKEAEVRVEYGSPMLCPQQRHTARLAFVQALVHPVCHSADGPVDGVASPVLDNLSEELHTV